MVKLKTIIRSAGLAAAFGVVGSMASALTCSTDKNTFSIDGAVNVECFDQKSDGKSANNDVTFFNQDPAPTVFDITGWMLADKTDGGGDGALTFVDFDTEGSSDSFSVSNPSGFKYAIALKKGNGFGFFEMPTSSGPFTWSLGDGKEDLSHASIYYTGMAAVPLPAGGLLLIGGLGGLAALRRRRKAA